MADDPMDIFEKMPTGTRLYIFDNEKRFGFYVSWVEKGTGFGTYTIAIDKETGEVHLDNETMGPEWSAKMLQRLVGTTVLSMEDSVHFHPTRPREEPE